MNRYKNFKIDVENGLRPILYDFGRPRGRKKSPSCLLICYFSWFPKRYFSDLIDSVFFRGATCGDQSGLKRRNWHSKLSRASMASHFRKSFRIKNATASLWFALFSLSGPLGAPFGTSWRLLGPLGGLLGASWGLLAPLGAILKFQSEFCSILAPQRVPKGSQKGAKMAPKRDPKRTKIEDEIRHEKKPLRIRLGAVLGRSWVVLGRHVEPKNLKNHGKT